MTGPLRARADDHLHGRIDVLNCETEGIKLDRSNCGLVRQAVFDRVR